MNEESKKILKENSLKITKARQKILNIFLSSRKPISAKEVKAKAKNIDEVTIYRNLEELCRAQIITRISISKDRSYFELVNHHHHHVVCNTCGRIEDLDDCLATKETSVLKKSKNFANILSHSLEYFGICRACHNR